MGVVVEGGLQCAMRRTSPFCKEPASAPSGAPVRSRGASSASCPVALRAQRWGLKRMSMSARRAGSAKSISLASRQRRFRAFGLEPDQSGFTSSSSCNTILPQSVLRNLNRPVSAMTLSDCMVGLHGNGQGFVTFHVRVAHRDRTASLVRAGQPDLPPLVDERVAAAALDPLQPDEMLSGLDRAPSEPALPRLAMESLLPYLHAEPRGSGWVCKTQPALNAYGSAWVPAARSGLSRRAGDHGRTRPSSPWLRITDIISAG